MKITIAMMALAALCQTVVFGQKKYQMVVEKNDGTNVTFNVSDVKRTVFIEAEEASYLKCPDDHHPHMIDLGLPSGTKWACCNVDADKPEAYGGYYAWGEIKEKSTYNWTTYEYGNSMTDLVNIGDEIATTVYDVATARWGAPWYAPSFTQIKELFENCTSEWVTKNGVGGREFTGTNGGVVFFPAAGYMDESPTNVGEIGFYWSSSVATSLPHDAWEFHFASNGAVWSSLLRYRGQSIRPVR